MGLFDNNGSGGNLSGGIIAVLGALLAGKLISNHIDQPQDGQQPAPPTPRPAPQSGGSGDGGILGGGLGGLLDSLRNAGHGNVADSWVNSGENKPIAPRDLGSALGQKTLGQLAAQAGMSEQEMLDQLSKVLPGVVDKLTPDGQVPDNAEVARRMGSNSPW